MKRLKLTNKEADLLGEILSDWLLIDGLYESDVWADCINLIENKLLPELKGDQNNGKISKK